ncbi:Hypothetical predicted protein, partial [Olea europaea subsp. europaea]
LAARHIGELATVAANVRTIFWQNITMRELLERMQGQLANSSHNKEVVPLEREAWFYKKQIESTPRFARSGQTPSYLLELATFVQPFVNEKSARTTSIGNCS